MASPNRSRAMASRRCAKASASRTSSRPSAVSASKAPSTRSARRRSASFRPSLRGAADSIAAYSSEIFGCTGSCWRACFSLSASAMASSRRTPCGCRRSATSRCGVHAPATRCRRRPAAPDTPARRRRRAPTCGIGASGNTVSPTCAMPCAAWRGECLRRALAEAGAQPGEVARFGKHRLPLQQAQVGAQVRLDARRHRNPSADTSTPESFFRNFASAPSMLSASGCGEGFREGAGEIRRRHEVAPQRLRQRADQRRRLVLHEARRQPRQPGGIQRIEQVQRHRHRHAVVHRARLEAVLHRQPRVAQRDVCGEARGIALVGHQQVVARPFQRGLFVLRQFAEPRIQRLRVVHVRRQPVQVPARLPVLVHHQADPALLGFLLRCLLQRAQVAGEEGAAGVDLAGQQRLAHEDRRGSPRGTARRNGWAASAPAPARTARSARCPAPVPAHATSADHAGVAPAGAAVRRSPSPARSRHWSAPRPSRCPAGWPTAPTAAASTPACEPGNSWNLRPRGPS